MHVWSKLSSAKWSDAWEERFAGLPNTPLVITAIPGRATIRVEVYSETEKQAREIQSAFGGSIRKLKNQNWAALTPDPLPPIKIRDRLLITSESKPASLKQVKAEFPTREVISAPADLAFGTGHHVTTATVLRLLCDQVSLWDRHGVDWDLADLGCGTGVLGIAAEKLGAKEVWGCDFDPMAVRVAEANTKRNRAKVCEFVEADVLKWKPRRKWHCLAANLFSDVLEAAFPTFPRALRKDGILLVSGILKSQAAPCFEAGRKAGFIFDQVITRGKWVTAQGRLA
jgi:ribosomal protein L11 methyltransferase